MDQSIDKPLEVREGREFGDSREPKPWRGWVRHQAVTAEIPLDRVVQLLFRYSNCAAQPNNPKASTLLQSAEKLLAHLKMLGSSLQRVQAFHFSPPGS